MSLWTRTEARAQAADDAHEVKAAYERGLTQARAQAATGAKDVKTAYEQGRRDERAERKRHPFIMAGLFALAIAGASLITLAAMNGSFTGGGQVADHQIAVAAPVVQGAVAGAGQAAQAAGSDLAQKGKALVSHDKN